MAGEDNKYKLYSALKEDGYDNFKDESDFNNYVSKPENRQKLFAALKEEGYDNFQSEADLDSYLGYSQEVSDIWPSHGNYEYKPEVQQHILQNKPEIFKPKKVDLGRGAVSGDETMDEQFAKRIDMANAYNRSDEGMARRIEDSKSALGEDWTDIENRIDTGRKFLEEERKKEKRQDYAARINLQNINSRIKPDFSPTRKKERQLNAAESLMNESYKMITAANNAKNGQGVIGNFIQGLGDEAFNLDNWTVGLKGAVNGNEMLEVLEKADKGEHLNKEEEVLLDAIVANAATQSFYSSDLPMSYNIGRINGGSIPFMVEMMLGVAPVSAGVNAATRGLLKYAAKRFLGTTVKKASTAAARNIVKGAIGIGRGVLTSAATTGTLDAGRVAENYEQRAMGDIDFDKSFNYTGRENMETGAKAWAKSFASVGLETQSELIGNQFAPIAGFIGKQVMRIPGINKIPSSKLGNWVSDAMKGGKGHEALDEFKKFAKQAQFHGVVGEYLEEVYNNIGSVALGDMSKEQLLDLDQNIETFLGVGVMSAAFGTVGSAAYMRDRYKSRKQMRNFENRMREADPAFDEWKSSISNMDLSQAKDYVKDIMASQDLTPEEKSEYVAYVANTLKEAAARNAAGNEEAGDVEREADNAMNEEMQQSFDEGMEMQDPEERHAAKKALDAAEEALGMNSADEETQAFARMVAEGSEDPNATFRQMADMGYSEDQLQKAADYYNARARFDGIATSIHEGIEEQIAEANRKTDMNVNSGSGMITPVKMKDGTDGFLVSGNVVTDESGNIDVNRSDQVIVVRDSNGEAHVFHPKDLSSRGADMSPDDIKATNETTLREQLIKEAEDQIDYSPEILSSQPQVGDFFTKDGAGYIIAGITPDGIVIMPTNEDGSPKSGKDARMKQIALDDWRKAKQAEFDASQQQQPESVPVSADVAPDETSTSTTTGSIPVDESRNPLYHHAPVEETVTDLTDGTLDQQEITDFISANRKKAQEAYKAVESKRPKIGTDKAKYVEEKRSWEAKKAEQERILSYWDEVESQVKGNITTENISQNGNNQAENIPEIVSPQPQPQAHEEKTPTKPTRAEDFSAMEMEDAFTALGERYGKNMPHKVEVTRKSFEEKLKKAQTALEKAEENYNNAPIGEEEKPEKALEKARQEFDNVKKQTDFWASMDNAIKEAQVSPLDESANEILANTEPLNGEELAAQQLGNGNIKLLRASFEAETGFGKGEARKYIGLFASPDKGGVSIQEAGELLMQADRENGTRLFDQNDPNAGRDAIINVLSQASTRGELAGYIQTNREAMAERERQAQYEDYARWCDENFHMTPEEYEAYESSILDILKKQALSDEEYNEFMSIFADEQTINDNGQQGINNQSEGSGEVLHGAQPLPSGRVEGIAEGRAETDGSVVGKNGTLQESTSGEIKPVGKGLLGNIFDQFKGKAKEAIDFLLNRKEGDAVAALHHKDIGDIDIYWGNEKAGLMKISQKHPEVLDNLQGIIDKMDIKQQSDNRIVLESDTHKAIVSKMLGDKVTDNWLLTAYEKKEKSVSASSSDIETEPKGKKNGTATLQNELSNSKDNASSPEKQTNATENRYIDVLAEAARIAKEREIETARSMVDSNPTESQKEAGNYRKGHIKLDGYDITIENPKGSERSGTDANGQKWSVTMHNDYGYIRGTKAVDGDHIDIFLSDNPTQGNVFVVDQLNEEGGFDESKVMYGFASLEEARTAYLSNYSHGWESHIGAITEVPKDEFKKWVDSSYRKTKPFSEYKSVKAVETHQMQTDLTPEEQVLDSRIEDASEEEEEETRFRESKNIASSEEVNNKFNEQLSGLTEENADKITFDLGMPSDVLLSAGVSNKSMKLYGNKIIKKMKKHGFLLSELKNLPSAVADPIGVFDNIGREGNRSVLTELKTKNGNFLVTIDLGKKKDIDFNIVSSVFGKTDSKIVDWINKGYASYINKKKALDYLYYPAPIAETPRSQELSDATKIVENFENPTLEQGKISSAIDELSEELHTPVEKITSADRLPQGEARRRIEAGDNVKGWYKNGKVYIYLPNAVSVEDAQMTILHEAVGHKAMREMFGKDFNSFLDYVRENAAKEIREVINWSAVNDYGADFREATEEYIASLAERMARGEEPSAWQKFVSMVKEAFGKLLRKFGFSPSFTITDGHLMYLLWKARRRMGLTNADILGVATDMAMQDAMEAHDAGETRYRRGKKKPVGGYDKRDALVRKYDNILESGMFNFQEAFQDSMLSLKVLMDTVVEATGKQVQGFEDAYMAENQMSSINKVQWDKYLDGYYKPLLKQVKSLSDKYGREAVEDYIYCKSGLERNEVLRARDAEAAYSEAKEELDAKLSAGQLTQDQYDTLLQKADNERAKALSEDVDYSGLRGLLFNKRLAEVEEQYEKGQITATEKKQAQDAIKGKEEEIIKDWKPFAEKAVADFESASSKEERDGLWKLINAATGETLRNDYESGMISRETYDMEKDMMKYYVPLRNWADMTAEDMYEYRHESSPVTSNQQTAKGRKSQADNPVATIALMGQNSIIRGNRNRMKQKFFAFVANRPTALAEVRDVWYVKDPVTNQWNPAYAETGKAQSPEENAQILLDFEDNMRKLEEAGMARKGKLPLGVAARTTQGQKAEHTVRVMINGLEYAVYVNGNPRAAQAVNGETNSAAQNQAFEWIDRMKRIYGAGLTSWNPDFVFPNAVRDTIHASTMTLIDGGPMAAARYLANVPNITWNLIKEIAWGKKWKNKNTKMHKYFQEFIENGGETGYTAVRSIDDFRSEFEKSLKDPSRYGQIKNGVLRKFAAILEATNRIAEDINRFNAYVSSRQSGESIARSINSAKNITVNFNKKGALNTNTSAWGKVAYWMNKWILFFNPSVQGLYQLVTKTKANPKRAASTCATIMATGFLMPMLNEWLLSMIGGDDKDDYWNQSDYKRRNNWLFYIGGGYISVPLPPVLREIYGMGDILYMAVTGRLSAASAAVDATRQMQSAIGFVSLIPEAGNEPDLIQYAKGFAPDLAAPFLDVLTNANFMGRPIAKWTYFNKYRPEHERVYKGVSPVYVELSRFLNSLGGGDDERRSDMWGNFINPAMMEHLINSYGGGIGKTINNLSGMILNAAAGEDTDPWRKSPIVPRFYTPNDERTVIPGINRRYNEMQYDYNIAKTALKNYKKRVKNGEKEYQKYIGEMDKNGEKAFIKAFEEGQKDLKPLQDKFKANPKDKELEIKIAEMKASIVNKAMKTRM